METNGNKSCLGITLGAIVLFALVAVGMVGCPRYEVYYQQMTGQAEFARAEQNRRIKIEEAKANLEAEKLNAQAEIERAKGAAEAIRIENGSITPPKRTCPSLKQGGEQRHQRHQCL